ncbi:MAG TPA: hypothetical protein VFD36_19265, partial [Kofleriaceae bacterium]|nr:hypothetical protein [Kofleriaceae bacterium]
MEANREPRPRIDRDTAVLRGWIDLAVGLALFAIGAIVYAATHGDLSTSDVTYFATYVPMVAGGMTAVRGIWRLVNSPRFGAGYKSFVAWRYLLVHDPKVTGRTKLALAAGLVGAVVLGVLRETPLAGKPQFNDPVWIAGAVAMLVFVGAVIIGGVLRYS